MDSGQVAVGCRVAVDGWHGTVRFRGVLRGTQGEWLGIEWDDASRGKHGGCYKGTQYFKTRHPSGGSFVRPAKADPGVSVTEAIKAKYFDYESLKNDRESGSNIQNIENDADVWLLGNVGNTRSNMKCIEFVGPERISEMQSRQEMLRIVNLHNMLVSTAGKDIPSVAPNIQELDLSHTLLSHWDTVAQIAQQLPHLVELKLGKNSLRVPSLFSKHQEAFQSVKSISLEACGLTWDHVLQLAQMWPHIEALEISANCIQTLSIPPKSVFFNLRALSLQENVLNSWQEVVKLAQLPKLKELYLNGCHLSEITFPGEPGQPTDCFAQLERLEIAANRLESWTSVAELEKLAALKIIRLNANPFLTSSGHDFDEAFNEIICRLGRVVNVNRMEVPKETRKNAELYYLKKYYSDYEKTRISGSNGMSEFLRLHPRFSQILSVYGEPAISTVDAGAPQTIKKTLLNLVFIAVENSALPSIEKRVPSSMTLSNLKKMVNVLFKQNGRCRPELTFYPTDGRFNDDREEYEFGNDLRDLNYYDLQNGDKIYVRW